MKLIKTNKGLKIETKYGNEAIHINHTHESIEDFQDDVWSPYMVAEECTNFARLHLVVASDEYHAFEQVDEYLMEKEGVEETHLIAVEELQY